MDKIWAVFAVGVAFLAAMYHIVGTFAFGSMIQPRIFGWPFYVFYASILLPWIGFLWYYLAGEYRYNRELKKAEEAEK